MGWLQSRLIEFDQALDYYHQALTISRDQGHSFVEADVLEHMAHTWVAKHQPDRARASWRQAHELFNAQHRVSDAQLACQQLDELG